MGEHGILDYNNIIDGIYIGTNMCCQTHFEEELKKEGIVADISLEADRVDAPFGVDFYLWLPVKDQTPPTPDQLQVGVTALQVLVKLKQKIYVHCKNGHGRAPTLVTAYLIKKGLSVAEALALVKHQRPAVHFQKNQEQALEEFSKNQ